MAMETASRNTVFAADKVDAATAPVKDGPSRNANPSSASVPVALLLCLQFLPINTQRLLKHSHLYMVSIHRTRMRTQVSSTMSSWENNSDSRLAQLETRACSALMRQVFAHSNIPSLAIVSGILADAEVGAAPDDWFRMLRCQRW